MNLASGHAPGDRTHRDADRPGVLVDDGMHEPAGWSEGGSLPVQATDHGDVVSELPRVGSFADHVSLPVLRGVSTECRDLEGPCDAHGPWVHDRTIDEIHLFGLHVVGHALQSHAINRVVDKATGDDTIPRLVVV